MRRRDFIALMGAGAAAGPVAAYAQQAAMPVIGFLSSQPPEATPSFLAAFRAGLSETGYVEGGNVAIEFRWAKGHYDRLPALAAELVQLKVSVIAATGGLATAQAAKTATTSIPIVFTTGFDPVALGLVASMNKPGGNLTGSSFFAGQLSAKRLEILRSLVPFTTIAMLTNPHNPNFAAELKDAEAAGTALGQKIRILNASDSHDFIELAAALAKDPSNALLVGSDPFLLSQRNEIVALAARYRIPAIYNEREFVAAGGLISYGANIADGYRQAGVYVGEILKGANPGDLPIMQPTKFSLVINLKTAKALGLVVPDKLLALADEVIE
jgi:putative tryptophan/tyrosine transport system substrate-binding protein